MNPLFDKSLPIREVRESIAQTFDEVFKRVEDLEEEEFLFENLKSRLETWQYQFLIASFFDGFSENGGWVHGLHCYYDDDPSEISEIIAAWEAIEATAMARTIKYGIDYLSTLSYSRFDELPEELWAKLEEAMGSEYGEPQDDDEISRLLHRYTTIHRSA